MPDAAHFDATGGTLPTEGGWEGGGIGRWLTFGTSTGTSTVVSAGDGGSGSGGRGPSHVAVMILPSVVGGATVVSGSIVMSMPTPAAASWASERFCRTNSSSALALLTLLV